MGLWCSVRPRTTSNPDHITQPENPEPWAQEQLTTTKPQRHWPWSGPVQLLHPVAPPHWGAATVYVVIATRPSYGLLLSRKGWLLTSSGSGRDLIFYMLVLWLSCKGNSLAQTSQQWYNADVDFYLFIYFKLKLYYYAVQINGRPLQNKTMHTNFILKLPQGTLFLFWFTL